MTARSPFVVSTLARRENFTDRKAEVARMRHAFEEPGAKLVVYGHRRQGKSSALERAAELARSKKRPIIILTLATASGMTDAANRLLSAIDGTIGRSWKDLVRSITAALRLGVKITPSADPLSGMPSVTLEPTANRDAVTSTRLVTDVLDQLERHLASKKLVAGLGLDEFQRLTEWGGDEIEWALKASLERHEHIGYVMAGSKKGMIETMVTDPNRALWKLAEPLEFGPMHPEHMAKWIRARAKTTGHAWSLDYARAIVRLAGPRTRDIVLLARIAWQAAQQGLVEPALDAVLDAYVQEQDPLHRKMWDALKARPQRILRVLAARQEVQILAKHVRDSYALGPASTVQGAVAALVESEHLVQEDGRLVFDDPFFRRWVQLNTLADMGLALPSGPTATSVGRSKSGGRT